VSTDPGVTARTRNPRGQGAILRGQLVAAAASLLASVDHPEALTLRRVAREVGIAPASIYGHFADLEDLLQHVLQLRYQELADILVAANDDERAVVRLVRVCAAYVRWGLEHPGEYRTLFGGRVPVGMSGTTHDRGKELLVLLTGALADATGSERAADIERQEAAGILLWTSLHGLVEARAEHPGIRWPAWSEQVITLVALHASRDRGEISEIAASLPGDPN
jgi:AcrR family transcriptional regulator